MTTPLWLSPLSHEVPWAGLPQPPAPPLWAYWCEVVGSVTCPDGGLHTATGAQFPPWVPVERPRVESGRTAGRLDEALPLAREAAGSQRDPSGGTP